jgi:hypothetical protein
MTKGEHVDNVFRIYQKSGEHLEWIKLRKEVNPIKPNQSRLQTQGIRA